jgi:hypothetical protein
LKRIRLLRLKQMSVQNRNMKYFLIAILTLSSFNIVFAQKKNKIGTIYTMTLETCTKTLDVMDTDTLFFTRFADSKGVNVMRREKLVLSISEKGLATYFDSLDLKDTNMMVYSFLYRRLFHSHPDSAVHKGKGYTSTGPIRLKGKSKNYGEKYILLGENYFLTYQVHNDFITLLKVSRKHKVFNYYTPIGLFTIVKIKFF